MFGRVGPPRRHVCRDRWPTRPCPRGLGTSRGAQTGGVRPTAAPRPAAASRCRGRDPSERSGINTVSNSSRGSSGAYALPLFLKLINGILLGFEPVRDSSLFFVAMRHSPHLVGKQDVRQRLTRV